MSNSPELYFQYEGRIVFQLNDLDKEYEEIEKNKSKYTARITYIAEKNGDNFKKKITYLEILQPNNGVFRTYEINQYETPELIEKAKIEVEKKVENSTPVEKRETSSTTAKSLTSTKTKPYHSTPYWRYHDHNVAKLSLMASKNNNDFGCRIGLAYEGDWSNFLIQTGSHINISLQKFDVIMDVFIGLGYCFDYVNLYANIGEFGLWINDDIQGKFYWLSPGAEIRVTKWLNITSEFDWLALNIGGNDVGFKIEPKVTLGLSFMLGSYD